MIHDWVLVETLGAEPVVVARGRQPKNLIPISAFLRRDPTLMAVQTAIAETVTAGQGLTSITPKSDRVIRTEVVQMSDGRIHGVHVWTGLPDASPPDRPIPGPMKWDLTAGVVTDTPESIANRGAQTEAAAEGPVVADLRADDDAELPPVESLSAIPEYGTAVCGDWDVVDPQGSPVTIGVVARALIEEQDDGRDHVICRAMTWRSTQAGPFEPVHDIWRAILTRLTSSGVHRVLLNLGDWTLLRWLDAPPPELDVHGGGDGLALVHHDDAFHIARMTVEFADGVTSGVLRLRSNDGGFVTMHVTVNRVEPEPGTVAALVTLRAPTDTEAASADQPAVTEAGTAKPRRRSRTRMRKTARP